MSEFRPTVDQARVLLEGRNTELIRRHLGVDPETLSDEQYTQALREAEWREAGLPSPSASAVMFSTDKGRFIPGRFAHHIREYWTFATLEDTDELLIYEPRLGVYVSGEPRLRGWVQVVMGEAASTHGANEVLGHIQRATYTPRDTFNPPGQLCLLNGVLDTETLELRPHEANSRFTVQLPVAYDEEADCPRFLRFQSEILTEEEARETIQMMFGYCLVPGNPYQVAFMNVGEGNNGKSTLLGVLKDMLGQDAISSETLQSLSHNRFAAASLWSKLANICADIPASPIQYTGVFKMATGGDPMRGEHKFQAAFTFVNQAKLIFSCNELPQVNDRTYAFWRRWVVIPYMEDFTDREDRQLLEKLHAEMSGILNWAIEGLQKIRERDGFPRSQTAEGLMEEWKCHADSLYWFVQECVEKDVNEWTSKDDLYEAYATFCDEHEVTKKKPEVVGKELPQHIPQVRRQRKRVDGKTVYGWIGCFLKVGEPDTPDYPDTPDDSPRLNVLGVLSASGRPPRSQKILALVFKQNVKGTCDFCKAKGEDLSTIGPRGSKDMLKVCSPCAETRFDFGPPPGVTP